MNDILVMFCSLEKIVWIGWNVMENGEQCKISISCPLNKFFCTVVSLSIYIYVVLIATDLNRRCGESSVSCVCVFMSGIWNVMGYGIYVVSPKGRIF